MRGARDCFIGLMAALVALALGAGGETTIA